jgi:general secretion pathway protein D
MKQGLTMMLKTRNAFFILPVLAVIFTVMGCAPSQMVYKPVTLPKPEEKVQVAEEKPQVAAIKAPSYEHLTPPVFKKAEPVKTLPPRTPIDPKLVSMYPGPVTINVENMPLADFIVYALGETLKVSFIMDENVMKNKKPVSMRMPQAMPADKALELLIGLLEKNNLYLEQKAGALYILSEAPPEQKGRFDIRVGRDTADSSSYILQVVPLRHVRPSTILPLTKELLKTPVQIQTTPRENALFLYGQAFQVKQIVEMIETFDVPYLQDKKLSLLRLTYWQSEEFIKELTGILKGIGFEVAVAANDPGPLFIPIKQLNGILVVSPDDETSKYILEWKERLDQAEAAGDAETAFSYSPKYSRASELVESIKKLYGYTPSAEAAPKQPTAAPARTGPAAAPQVLGLPGLKISADDSKNIIIIIGSPSVYKNILRLLQSLDTPPRQVLIEATIAELTLTDELKYGVEWFVKNSMSGGAYTLGTLGKFGVGTISGLSYSFLSETGNLQVLISALASANKANILSTPRLTVLDNKEATIQVGQDVPTVTGEATASDISTTTTTPSVLRSIQYRNTGIILRVKPTINTEGLVTLDISQEVSTPGADGAGGSPIFLMRKINTSVVVANGQTIALGGLMQENDSTSEQKVPLLGDIPLIGNLFKYSSKKKEKTELLVLVTPTILSSTSDAAQITDELKKELKWLK